MLNDFVTNGNIQKPGFAMKEYEEWFGISKLFMLGTISPPNEDNFVVMISLDKKVYLLHSADTLFEVGCFTIPIIVHHPKLWVEIGK